MRKILSAKINKWVSGSKASTHDPLTHSKNVTHLTRQPNVSSALDVGIFPGCFKPALNIPIFKKIRCWKEFKFQSGSSIFIFKELFGNVVHPQVLFPG